jgi:predicted RNase H-like nuclease
LGGRDRRISEFKASLVYKVPGQLALYRETLSQKTRKTKQNKTKQTNKQKTQQV